MFSSHLFWTSGLSTYQPRSHRISHPPSFCGACLKFSRERRIQPFVSLLTGRGVELCVLTNLSFSNSWAYSLYKKYLFFSYTGIRTHVPTSEGFEVIIPTEPPGRPACVIKTFRWGLLVQATKLCPFARAYGKYGNCNYAH